MCSLVSMVELHFFAAVMWQSLNTEEQKTEMTTSFKLNFRLATFQGAYKGSKCHKAYLEACVEHAPSNE